MKKKTKEEKLIAKRISNAKWYEKNKDKQQLKQSKYHKEYYKKNKEKKLRQVKEWYEKNKEIKIEYNKKYKQTEKGKRKNRIHQWKFTGVEHDDWDALYEHYINCKKCENCGIELTEGRKMTPTTRCLDHDHETGKFRNVLCHSCNRKRG